MTQTVPLISAVISDGSFTSTIPPFTLDIDPTPYDCGLQTVFFPEDGAFSYPYSAFLTTSTQTVKTDSFVITAITTDDSHANTHSVSV